MGMIRQYLQAKVTRSLVAGKWTLDDIKKELKTKLRIFCMTKLAVRL